MLKVGVIDYINFLPFFAAFQQKVIDATVEWVPGVPSVLNQSLREGSLDISPISAAEYLINKERYQLLPDFCIGAKGKVLSVCLYVRGDLNGTEIGLASQSASSALLVRVLCHHFWKVSPSFTVRASVNELKTHDAFLLIGDDCLRNPHIPGFKTIDLAQAWFEATNLPFTFAVFAARKEVKQQDVDQTRHIFHLALEWGETHSDVVEALAQKRCALPPEVLKEYYSILRYRLDDGQRKGLELFETLAAAVPQYSPKATSHVLTSV